MNTKNNESAFPLANSEGHFSEGMSIRDYMAIAAMNGMISAPNFSEGGRHVVGLLSENLSFTGGWKGRIAFSAYAMADEMLKARETK